MPLFVNVLGDSILGGVNYYEVAVSVDAARWTATVWEVSQWSTNTGKGYPTSLRNHTTTMTQTCQYRHSQNQSLVAHTGSAT
eukprot:3901284-Pleurochrysis_carterae.AAC.1